MKRVYFIKLLLSETTKSNIEMYHRQLIDRYVDQYEGMPFKNKKVIDEILLLLILSENCEQK